MMPLSNCSVVIRSVTRTKNSVGDATRATNDTPLAWALIAPRSSAERTDARVPAVISAATIYGPFDAELDADDLLIVSDHSPTMDGEWQVEGLPGGWALGDWQPGFEVAVKRAGSL